jgi:hypothetical protein
VGSPWDRSENHYERSARDKSLLQLGGGRAGIRTRERVAPLAVFKTAAFVRSATLPQARVAEAAQAPRCPAPVSGTMVGPHDGSDR